MAEQVQGGRWRAGVVVAVTVALAAGALATSAGAKAPTGPGKGRTTTTTAAPTTTTVAPTTTTAAPTTTTAMPTTTTAAPVGVWTPALTTSWHWMIDHELDLSDPKDMGLTDRSGVPLSGPPPEVYDIDWEFNPASTVAALHAMGKKVICYVDVGVYEDYRSDAGKFPASVIGAPDVGWDGSWWLDIRQLDVLLPIMRSRFEVCKAKGFDAIEPDEIDGYSNESGFPLTYDDQLRYNRAIADLARSLGLSVGLKGDIEQVPDLWTSFDWSLNEECFRYNECGDLATYFVQNGKAVFQVEYGRNADPAVFCPKAKALGFNSMKMPLALNGGRLPCP